MKLLVVTQYFQPENFRVNELVAELVARGHEVTVLTGLPNYPQGRCFPGYGWRGPWRECRLGAEVVRVPMLLRGRGNGWRLALNYLSFAAVASLAALWRISREHDAVFVFAPSPVTVGLPAIVAAWRCHAPILFWVLDLWPESLAATGAVRSKLVLGLVGRLVRWTYAKCQRILVSSRGFVEDVEQHGVPPDRICYFPNWVEADFLVRATSPPPWQLPNGFLIVFAGNIGSAQGFPAIIAAAEKVAETAPHVRWVIAGDGRMAEWAKAEVTRLRLDDKVVFLGQQPSSTMPSLLAAADALLVSLRADRIFERTVPGKVQSYLAAGRPILAMLDGEGARLVSEASAGLVSPADDALALAANVCRLVAATDVERKEMGERGKAYALREFSRDPLLDRLLVWCGEAVEEFRQRST